MLADTLDTVPANAAAWLACLAFFVVLVNQILKLRSTLFPSAGSNPRRIEPQPLEVLEAKEAVVKKDFEKRNALVDALFAELRATRSQDAKDWGASRAKLYEEVRSVRVDMTSMEQRLNAAEESRITKVHDRVNDILEAVGELRGRIEAR
jgi:hypothetical protein